jgi:hypothetical protein
MYHTKSGFAIPFIARRLKSVGVQNRMELLNDGETRICYTCDSSSRSNLSFDFHPQLYKQNPTKAGFRNKGSIVPGFDITRQLKSLLDTQNPPFKGFRIEGAIVYQSYINCLRSVQHSVSDRTYRSSNWHSQNPR